MTLDQNDKDVIAHLADEVQIIASWQGGARETQVNLIADRLRSVVDGSYGSWYGDAKAQADALALAEAQLKAEQEAEARAAAAAETARQKAQEKAQQ